jgi:hypothetical protein
MHRSLDASSKQLTCFFDAQKNLSFSLENNTVKTYIHANDQNPISTEVLSSFSSPPSSPIPINIFEKNNLTKWKNYFSMSGFMSNNSLTTSGFTSNNSPDNSLTKSLKSTPTLSSSVFFKHESKQYLDSRIVFPPLPLFISHPPQVDSQTHSTDPDIDFEDLILYLVYGSSSFPSSFPSSSPSSSSSSFPSNNITVDNKSQQEFLEFHKLSVHVFSSPFFFYYSLQ